jgi:hypothetical protein
MASGEPVDKHRAGEGARESFAGGRRGVNRAMRATLWIDGGCGELAVEAGPQCM